MNEIWAFKGICKMFPRVINEVNYFKAKNGGPNIKAAKLKAKSIAAKLGMQWCRVSELKSQ